MTGNTAHATWSLAPFFGYEHSLFVINTPIILSTWAVLIVIAVLILFVRFILAGNEKHREKSRFVVIKIGEFFITLCNQALTTFSFNHFSFITALFLFIFLCNTISLIPWLEEPTADLNTALGLGITAFLYVQATALAQHGPISYVKGYLTPFFLMAPLNVVGKLASLLSMSFRLFGNIFGGAMVTGIYLTLVQRSIIFEILGLVSGLGLVITLFFIIFEGILQAFVFTMLTLTYLSLAIRGEGH